MGKLFRDASGQHLHAGRRIGEGGIQLRPHWPAPRPLFAAGRVLTANIHQQQFLAGRASREPIVKPLQRDQRFLDGEFAFQRDQVGLIVQVYGMADEHDHYPVLPAGRGQKAFDRLLDNRLDRGPHSLPATASLRM